MKRPLQIGFLLLMCMAGNGATAQTAVPFNNSEVIDVNNIKAVQLVHGDMWHNADSSTPGCEFPKGSGKHIGYTGSLWMGGYSTDGQLRVAAQTYRQDGNDYWPGPAETTPIGYHGSEAWARVWKVTQDDITTFLSTSSHSLSNTPASILDWPGKGNSNAKGNGGISIAVPYRDMAPFVDVNGNGIYDPLLGDYPEIKGDMMLWNVFSDKGPTHDQSSTESIGVEVHCAAYAYSRGSAVDNIIFYEYDIINRSLNTIDSFAVGFYADLDLGYSVDDYVGFDSTRNLAYTYNGSLIDGTGPDNGYGANIPVAGVRVLMMPGDNCGSISPAQSFMSIQNAVNNVTGNPSNGLEFNNFLRSTWKNGQALTNDFQGAGVNSNGTGTGPNTNYVFAGNPGNSNEWTECSANNTPGDRRMVIGSKPFTMLPGQVWKMAIALVASDPALHNACPNIDISELLMISDTAQEVFCNPLAPITGINDVTINQGQLLIYPSPAQNNIVVDHPLQEGGTVKIFDAVGSVVATSETRNLKTELNVASLPHGVYHVLLMQNDHYYSGSFIKD